jgi:hypothetical protein
VVTILGRTVWNHGNNSENLIWFRVYKEPRCQGLLTESTYKGDILVFGKTLELETVDNEIIALGTKMADETLWTSFLRQIWSKNTFNTQA